MISDKQVLVALQAAQDEFAMWRIIPRGDAGTRVVRDPIFAHPPETRLPENVGELTVSYVDMKETGDEAKKLFNDMRAQAGMRKALESVT